MSETAEQERFRIFAMTHKKPTQAADEWIADRRELAELRENLCAVIGTHRGHTGGDFNELIQDLEALHKLGGKVGE